MSTEKTMTQLNEVASRIREMRDIMGMSAGEMAKKTEVTLEEYEKYENGAADMPFAFVHKCALAFGMELTELLEGKNAHLSSYTVTRKGKGQETAKEDGITISNLA
ncbi:MAG: helix-turn-helix transcriptional regulator, partial [Oscillospiraceae bacterium]|nr:helix-turn-helix transcriptional regulator [Oscillospiraceae bacterium]